MSKDPADADGPEVEGSYTDSDGESAKPLGVRGEYTESEENPDPEPEEVRGHYTDTDTDPDAHDRDDERGHYTDADE